MTARPPKEPAPTTLWTTDPETRMRFIYNLRAQGVSESRVLTAIESVDRSLFVSGSFQDHAFENTPLPIGAGQTISQPSIVGLMTQALNIGPRDRVLEIGTGSGYQAAILSRLARRVYTVERHRSLARAAQNLFEKLGFGNITCFTSDGSFGLPEQAPFDRIIVTAAAEDPPSPLMAQLKPGGIMIVPVGQSDTVQTLIKVTRHEHGYDYHEICKVRFVPLLEGIAKD